MKKNKYLWSGVTRFSLLLVTAIAMGSLNGCKLILLDPKGIIAAAEKQLLLISVVLMLIVVVPVIILTMVFAWKYRAGNTLATYAPDWDHSTSLELIWWSIPCIIVFFLAMLTWTSTFQLDPYKSLAHKNEKVITIQAIALQWKWLFIYPEQHLASVNYIQVPVGVPIQFLITAEGPMNSIQIPQLVGQIYAMAGMQTKLNLRADETGEYQGVSANFTGDGFSDMHFKMRVSTQKEFDQWVKKVQQAPEKLTQKTYEQLVVPAVLPGVKYYTVVKKDIFERVVMKGMMPIPEQ